MRSAWSSSGPATWLTRSQSSREMKPSGLSIVIRRVRPPPPPCAREYIESPMCESVGPRCLWICTSGQVGMVRTRRELTTDRLQPPPHDEQWRRVEDRAVGSGDYPDQQRESETLQGVANEQQQRQKHENH